MKKISIISPCYNEGPNVKTCYEELSRLFKEELPNYDWELIFADNFSTDDTVVFLKDLAKEDPDHVKVIINARNYGVDRSTFNALKSATGDAIVPMVPVDLQDPPEAIPKMIKEWENGYKVVYGMRYQREESFAMKNVRRLFYVILHHFSDINIPKYAGEFQVIDRSVLEALRQYNDYYPFIRGMIANVNAHSKGIHYTWKKREHGVSKNQNLLRLYDQGINGLISFSKAPVRILIFFGFSVSLMSLGFVVFQFLEFFFFRTRIAPPGINTLIVGMFFFFGILFVFLGLLGEYIAAIHSQLRSGTKVIESERINFNTKE